MIASTSTSPLPLAAMPIRCAAAYDRSMIAAVQERPAIVDAHDHALAGRDVGHARIRRQRQRRMRGGHRVHVVGLADRRLLAVELAAVPRRDAALLVRPQRGRRHVVLARAPCTAGWRSGASGSSRGAASGIASRLAGGLRRGRRPCSTWPTAVGGDAASARLFLRRAAARGQQRRARAQRGERAGRWENVASWGHNLPLPTQHAG